MSQMDDFAGQIEGKRENDMYQTFSYHSWVSRARKYLYVAVGKNACTRIKSTLLLLDGKDSLDVQCNWNFATFQ